MTIQLAVFLVYFAVLFVIGRVSLARTTTEADYWIAGGKLGWLVGGATLAATHASAGTFVGHRGCDSRCRLVLLLAGAVDSSRLLVRRGGSGAALHPPERAHPPRLHRAPLLQQEGESPVGRDHPGGQHHLHPGADRRRRCHRRCRSRSAGALGHADLRHGADRLHHGRRNDRRRLHRPAAARRDERGRGDGGPHRPFPGRRTRRPSGDVAGGPADGVLLGRPAPPPSGDDGDSARPGAPRPHPSSSSGSTRCGTCRRSDAAS